MIRVTQKGSFKNFFKLSHWAENKNIAADLDTIGRICVRLLAQNTPVDSGKTSSSWYYTVEKRRTGYRVVFRNDNIEDGALVAILIQYGHATGTGGYIPAIDFINPVTQPIFNAASNDIWEEVKRV